jgi:REP element-mobilizing transposase RayT
VVADVSSLRQRDMYLQLREATIVTAKRENFRIVHMSIQRNHIHLIVEAEHKEALSRGMQGFSISAAKRVKLPTWLHGSGGPDCPPGYTNTDVAYSRITRFSWPRR